jgi:acyl-homoserine lactone acylase PvdQ
MEPELLTPTYDESPASLSPAFVFESAIPDPEPEEELPEKDDLSEFDPRYRDPFLGLLYLGFLTKEEEIFGHSFKLVTPGQRTRFEAGLLHKPYLNSMEGENAWATVQVAAYLLAVDGTELPGAIGPKSTGVTERYNWVVDNLHRTVIQDLYLKTLSLEAESAKALEELRRLGEASG